MECATIYSQADQFSNGEISFIIPVTISNLSNMTLSLQNINMQLSSVANSVKSNYVYSLDNTLYDVDDIDKLQNSYYFVHDRGLKQLIFPIELQAMTNLDGYIIVGGTWYREDNPNNFKNCAVNLIYHTSYSDRVIAYDVMGNMGAYDEASYYKPY